MWHKVSYIVVAVILVLLAVSIYKYGPELKGAKKATILVKGRVFSVEVVDTPIDKAVGLAGRDSLGENEGMLFVFKKPSIQKFWMKGMSFPIDIIWMRKNGEVVGFDSNVRPQPNVPIYKLSVYSSKEPVDRVLELPAGAAASLNLVAGDTMTIKL